MGLDMFFYAVYKNENGTSQGRKEAIYWRKANGWFVDEMFNENS